MPTHRPSQLTFDSNSVANTMGEGFPIPAVRDHLPSSDVDAGSTGVHLELPYGSGLSFKDNVPHLQKSIKLPLLRM